MRDKNDVVGEMLRQISSGKIHLVLCSSRFKNKYFDAVDIRSSVKNVLWVEFDTKKGTLNVSNYEALVRRAALLINDFPMGAERDSFNEAAHLAMGAHDTKIIDTLYFPTSK